MALSNIELSSCVDPAGPAAGDNRVFRGCAWSRNAQIARAETRRKNSPDVRGNNVGFRLAKSVT